MHRCAVHFSAAFPAVLYFALSPLFCYVRSCLLHLGPAVCPLLRQYAVLKSGLLLSAVFFSYRYVAAGPALIKAALIALSAQTLDGISLPFSASPRSVVAWWARLRVARRRADWPPLLVCLASPRRAVRCFCARLLAQFEAA